MKRSDHGRVEPRWKIQGNSYLRSTGGSGRESVIRSSGDLKGESFFGDLRRTPVEREHNRHRLPKVCVQQFLYKNGAQLCSYLVSRFVFDQG